MHSYKWMEAYIRGQIKKVLWEWILTQDEDQGVKMASRKGQNIQNLKLGVDCRAEDRIQVLGTGLSWTRIFRWRSS